MLFVDPGLEAAPGEPYFFAIDLLEYIPSEDPTGFTVKPEALRVRRW
jgi:hypothetical protein